MASIETYLYWLLLLGVKYIYQLLTNVDAWPGILMKVHCRGF